MKTLATVWDQIAVGRSHSVADPVAQRLKALELSRRAQSPGARRGRDGLKRVGRGARMRKLQRRQPTGRSRGKGSQAKARTAPPPREASSGHHGDVLPLHPGLVTPGLKGITKDNIHWVRAVLIILNYLYCAAWSKPVCVPMVTGHSARHSFGS